MSLPLTPYEAINAPGPWTHRLVSANGAQFHLAEAGEGPLVIFLHGFPQYWWTWRAYLPALAAAGYRAAAMDLRGYGGSDHSPRGYDPTTLSNDVLGVISCLGEQSAVIVGHGWGAHIGWTSARRSRMIRGITSISAPHPVRLREAARTQPQIKAWRYALRYQWPWLPERDFADHDAARVTPVRSAHGRATSTMSKSAFAAPQSGQLQSSGMSSQRVPGSMPSSGQPCSSSYSKPHCAQRNSL